MSLQTRIDALCRITHELLHLGLDGSPIYSTDFCRLNTEVYRQADMLYTMHGSDTEEEARLCHALLSAYHATIYDHGNKSWKIQKLLNRSTEVLGKLPASLVKCQLLVACYGELFDEELAREAHAIINIWSDRDLNLQEREVFEYLESLEANPRPNWEIVE